MFRILLSCLLVSAVLAGQTCTRNVPTLTDTSYISNNPNAPNNQGSRTVPRAYEVGDFCLGDNPATFCNAGAFGQCTSNDVKLARAKSVQGTQTCTIGNQITLTIAVQWVATANQRYDVSAYIAMDGGDALYGSCYGTILYGNNGGSWPNDPYCTPTGGKFPNKCPATSIAIGSDSTLVNGPYLEDSQPLDQCRDLQQDQVTWQTLQNVPFICRDLNNDGTADVSACLGWQNNPNEANCNGIDLAIVTAGSKCNCEASINIEGLTVCSAQQTLCYGSVSPYNLNADVCEPTFSARFKVRASQTAENFPAGTILYGNIYYDFQDGNQRMALQYFDPSVVSTDATFVSTKSPTWIREDVIWPCKSLQRISCGSQCSTLFYKNWLPRLFREGYYPIDTQNSKLSPDSQSDVTCPSALISGTPLPDAPTATWKCRTKTILTNAPMSAIQTIWYATDSTQSSRTVIGAAQQRDGTLWEFFKIANGGTSCAPATLARGVTLADASARPKFQMPWILPSPSDTGTCPNKYNFTALESLSGCSTTQPLCTADTQVAFAIDTQSTITVADWTTYWIPYVWRTVSGFDPTNNQTQYGFCFSSGATQSVGSAAYCNPLSLSTDEVSTCNSYLKVGGKSGYPDCGNPSSLGKFGGTGTDFRALIKLSLDSYFTSASSVARRLVVLVGGPDVAGTVTWKDVSDAAIANNVQIHAVGIGAGATQTTLLGTIINSGIAGGTVSTWGTAALLSGDNYLYRKLCPAGTPACDCNGFCTCGGAPVCTACGDATNKCVGALTCSSANPCLGCQPNPGNVVDCSKGISPCQVPGTCDPSTGICSAATNKVCSGKGVCLDGKCDPSSGNCGLVPNNNCDDRNPCTTDACSAVDGLCSYTPVNCDDGNICTVDSCQGASGLPVCLHDPRPASFCDDKNACTIDTCPGPGGCVHTPVVCDTSNKCVTVQCDPINGCTSTPINCDDGNQCTIDGCQSASGCTHTSRTCADGNACTDDSCSPSSGCVFTPINVASRCNDGNKCTQDTCDSITGCLYTPFQASDCSDGNKCTTDSCDTALGCVFTPVQCTSSAPCISSSCNSGTGACDTTAISDCTLCATTDCSAVNADLNACREKRCAESAAQCNAETRFLSPTYTKALCNAAVSTPGNFYCYVADLSSVFCPNTDACFSNTCSGPTGSAATCTKTQIVFCNDGNKCTTDSCLNGVCVYDTTAVATCAARSNFCATYACTPSTGNCDRTPTVASACNDNNVCTQDLCDESQNKCVNPANSVKTNCDLKNAADLCFNWMCDSTVGCKQDTTTAKLNCNDGNACTADGVCDPVSGCPPKVNTQCTSTDPCISKTCSTTTGLCVSSNVNSPSCLGCASATDCATLASANKCRIYSCVDLVASCSDTTLVQSAQKTQCLADIADTTKGHYCAWKAKDCGLSTTCTDVSCDTTSGLCKSVPSAVANGCDKTDKCNPQQCVDGTGCVATKECLDVTLPNVCKTPVCQLDSTTTGGFTCVASSSDRDCTDYTCTAQPFPLGCTTNCQSGFYVEYVVGGPNRDQFLANYASRSPSCTPISCTADRCDTTLGCVNDFLACQVPENTCNVTIGCFEAGNPYGFTPGECKLQIDQSLIDFCGVCFGDFASCFFQTVLPVTTVAAIAGGAVAGITIAAIIAALLIFWLTKKGYDYWQAQSQLASTGLNDNPAYITPQSNGAMPE